MGAGKWYPGVIVLLILLLNRHKNRQSGRCLNNVCCSWRWASQPHTSAHGALKNWCTNTLSAHMLRCWNIPESFYRCCGEDLSGLMNAENDFKQLVSSLWKGNRHIYISSYIFRGISLLPWSFQAGRGVRIFLEIPCIGNNNNNQNNNVLMFLDFILNCWIWKEVIDLNCR